MSLVTDILTFDAVPPVANCSCVRCGDKGGRQTRAVAIYYNSSKCRVAQLVMKRRREALPMQTQRTEVVKAYCQAY